MFSTATLTAIWSFIEKIWPLVQIVAMVVLGAAIAWAITSSKYEKELSELRLEYISASLKQVEDAQSKQNDMQAEFSKQEAVNEQTLREARGRIDELERKLAAGGSMRVRGTSCPESSVPGASEGSGVGNGGDARLGRDGERIVLRLYEAIAVTRKQIEDLQAACRVAGCSTVD